MKGIRMHGIHVPIVTPFAADGTVDVASLERLADHLLNEGAAGLVTLGTTGEGPLLTPEERTTVVDVCRQVSDAHGTPLTIGVGSMGTADSARQAAGHAAAADVLLASVPYYLRPTDEGVLDHFAAMDAAAGVPLVVYNVPYRSGKTLHVPTLLELLSRPYIAGIKHCAGALDAGTLRLLSEGHHVLGGDDAFLYPMLQLGAVGGIVASANVAPGAFVAMAAAVDSEDAVRARTFHNALLPLVRALFAEPAPSVVKAVLAATGVIAHATVRSPLRPPADVTVATALDALKVLRA